MHKNNVSFSVLTAKSST